MYLNLRAFEALTKEYNILRSINQDKILSSKEVTELTKFIPCSKGYLGILVKHGLLEKGIQRGTYIFPKEPILFTSIKKVIEELREKNRMSNAKWNAKKNPKNSEQNADILIEDFLKSHHLTESHLAEYLANTNNFRVIAKKVTWEEL